MIDVVAYDPEWPQTFEKEQELRERVLAPWLHHGVHHVSSTAIPGLAPKPVIDMIASVRDFEEAAAPYAPLEVGYVAAPHRPASLTTEQVLALAVEAQHKGTAPSALSARRSRPEHPRRARVSTHSKRDRERRLVPRT